MVYYILVGMDFRRFQEVDSSMFSWWERCSEWGLWYVWCKTESQGEALMGRPLVLAAVRWGSLRGIGGGCVGGASQTRGIDNRKISSEW